LSGQNAAAQNCTFYPSAAAAEQAGFRPCLLCCPELAPGNARINAAGRLAAAVAKRMEEGSFIEQRFGDLAQEFGVSDTRLGSAQIYSLWHTVFKLLGGGDRSPDAA
jgi:methylphosphotriester-DNA--protein-cysteine methyltransferase